LSMHVPLTFFDVAFVGLNLNSALEN